MLHQRTTDLIAKQFAIVLQPLTHHFTWAKPAQKPYEFTRISYRQDITQEVLAHFFEVLQPAISRTISTIEKRPPLVQPLKENLKVSGALVFKVPTSNWSSLGKANFSGMHKRALASITRLFCTLVGKLLGITDPVPDARHDVYAFKHHGLDQMLDSSTLADKGYLGLALATLRQRSKNRRIPADVKMVNRFISSRRAVIAQVKTGRILHSGFRRPLGLYSRAFAVVRGCFF